ncbi:surface-adhesin E family protein [Acidisoma sp. 7E03]
MIISRAALLATVLSGFGCAYAIAADAPAPDHWIATGTSNASFVNTQSVIRKDDYAVIWRMQNFAQAEPVGQAQARSAKIQVEYNCAAARERALSAELYSGRMATGSLVGLSYQQHPWQPAQPTGHGFALACGHLTQPAVVASAP